MASASPQRQRRLRREDNGTPRNSRRLQPRPPPLRNSTNPSGEPLHNATRASGKPFRDATGSLGELRRYGALESGVFGGATSLLASLGLLVLLAATTTACDSCRRRDVPTSKESVSTLAGATQEPPFVPLQAANRAITLAIRGQADAELLVPIGATTARPLVVMLMPSGLHLRSECEAMAASIRETAFILCQLGRLSARPAARGEADADFVASALKALLQTVKRQFGRYVASKDLVLVGVGEAADAVAPIVRQAPDFFRRVALLDGGFRSWTSVDSTRFVSAGGKAFLARCAEGTCRNEAMRVVATLKAGGIAARLEPETFEAASAKPADSAKHAAKTAKPAAAGSAARAAQDALAALAALANDAANVAHTVNGSEMEPAGSVDSASKDASAANGSGVTKDVSAANATFDATAFNASGSLRWLMQVGAGPAVAPSAAAPDRTGSRGSSHGP